ncbi:MAG: response regulator [Methanomicrobiaceae archaeon]|nr:response regulator [Methanomicrobiaceae archaeon]
MMKVLLVDEEPEILSIAEIYLKKFGDYEFKKALSAKEALDLLRNEKFDAIVSDYEMPEMDGLEFLKLIREEMSLIPFILFSGKGREEIIIEAFRSGADGYVQKGKDPLANFGELSHQVEIAVSRRNAEIELRTKEYAIEHSINGLSIADYDTGQIFYANAAALDMFGYTLDDLSTLSTAEFLADGNYDELKTSIMKSLDEDNYFIGRIRVKRKDGSDFHISVSITTLLPDELVTRKMIFISFIDITSVVRSEEEFLDFILEASRRIRKPVSLIGQSLEVLAEDIDAGTDPEIMKLKILVLIKNAGQIVNNLNELNMAVTEAHGTISEEYKSFLVK